MIDFGTGVTLGPLDHRDMDLIRLWRNDWRVWRWCRQNDVISDWDQSSWYSSQSADPTIRMYMVSAGQELVGVAGLTSIDPINRRAEFSLYVAPHQRGHEYGRKALETLLAHGFQNLNLNCIWGESFLGNKAMTMFFKLGFKDEGYIRDAYFREGKYVPAIRFSILRSEWEEKCLPSLQQSGPLTQESSSGSDVGWSGQ